MKKQLVMPITILYLCGAVAKPNRLSAQEQVAPQETTAKHTHYKAVDIPTFGGPASYINPASVFGSPTQINSRGTAVGAAATSIPYFPTSNGFVCFGPEGVVPFVYHAFKWMNESLTDLGTLSGPDECSEATSINAKGQIVGTSEENVINPVLGIKQIRAVLWEDSEIKSLGTFGGNHSAAAANNNKGEVVGFALNAIPDPFSLGVTLLKSTMIRRVIVAISPRDSGIRSRICL